MGTKNLMRKAVGTVGFFFAMFGAFFLKIAPPEEVDARFGTGVASVCVLIVLLFVSNLKPKRRQKRSLLWLRIAAFAAVVGIIAGITYKFTLDKFTFPWPPESREKNFVAGFALTARAQAYQKDHPLEGNAGLVADFGGIEERELVWTWASIEIAKTLLFGMYLTMVLAFATSIFSLLVHSTREDIQ